MNEDEPDKEGDSRRGCSGRGTLQDIFEGTVNSASYPDCLAFVGSGPSIPLVPPSRQATAINMQLELHPRGDLGQSNCQRLGYLTY